MNHTPAPWFRDGLTVYALTKDHRGRECNRFTAKAQSARQRHEAWEVELRANAELMKAAPKLFEACRVIASAELYDPATGIIDADVLEACQEVAREAMADALTNL